MDDTFVLKNYPRSLLRAATTLRHLVLCIVIAGFANTAVAEQLVTEFKGVGDQVTEEFEISGPWLLDWHVTSDYAETLGIEVNLVDAVFLSYKGVVFVTRYPGSGTKLFYDSGRFRFKVLASMTNWRLRVSKITEEEAARMIRVGK